jgi:hypothetical protein
MRNALLLSLIVGFAMAAAACSGSSDSTGQPGSGGAPDATGGGTTSGGASASSQGGSPAGGAATGDVATGGVATGGVAAGGAAATGGMSTGGATSGGSTGTGGVSTTGGRTGLGGRSGSGGASPTGGSTDSGGVSTTGGRTGLGGRSGSGGTSLTGGSTSTGGSAGSGGTSTAAGSPGTCDSGPLSEPLPGCEPTPVPDTGDYYADCVARINQLRWECQCLPPLDRWSEGEACADQQAQYDYEHDEAHAGFSARICENGGSAQNECPGYGARFGIIDYCLQQMWDEGPGEPYSAHGHYINMTNSAYTKVACGRYTTPDGEVWAVQNFSR